MESRRSWLFSRLRRAAGMRDLAISRESLSEPVKKDVDDWRGIEREHLTDQESTHHRDAQRASQFGSDAMSKGQRQTAKQRRHGGHHDRPETQQAGFVDSVGRAFAMVSLGIERE